MKKRENDLDSLKLIAILMVILSHFFADAEVIDPSWKAINLIPVLGKAGVGIFACVTGLLAYRSGKSGKDTFRYIIRRYMYFAVCGFVANTIFYIVNPNSISREEMNFFYVLGQSITLGDGVFATFWFARDFFFGCTISFIIGKYGIKAFETLCIMMIMLCKKEIFLSSCLYGCIIDGILDKYGKKKISSVFYFASLILYIISVKMPESYLRYFFCCLFGFVLVVSFKSEGPLNKFSNNRYVSFLGKYTMGMMILHTLIYGVLFKYYANKLSMNLIFVIWLSFTMLLSIPLEKLIKTLYLLADKLLMKIIDYI